jgi:hypothetical protein
MQVGERMRILALVEILFLDCLFLECLPSACRVFASPSLDGVWFREIFHEMPEDQSSDDLLLLIIDIDLILQIVLEFLEEGHLR